MSIHLGVPRTARDTSVVIIFVCKYLCRIYYTFKEEFRCVVVIEKEKDVMDNKGEICAYSNVNRKSA